MIPTVSPNHGERLPRINVGFDVSKLPLNQENDEHHRCNHGGCDKGQHAFHGHVIRAGENAFARMAQ